MHAEQEGDQGHYHERHQAFPNRTRTHEQAAQPDTGDTSCQVDPVARGQEQGPTHDHALQFSKRNHRSRERHRPDQYTEIDFDIVYGFFDPF